MAVFDVLLDVQAHDTHLDQLRRRRATLPERAELADVDRRLKEVGTRLTGAKAARDDVVARQTELEREMAASETRIAEIDKRMYSGEVSASRDLTAMADEIKSIKRRVSGLEDTILEVLDEREPLDSIVGDLEAERDRLESERAGVLARLAEGESAIDDEAASEQAVREQTAAGLPPDLLATYEKLRARLDGVGVARLDGRRCAGCHLELPATELDRLRKLDPEALAYCDQCGRILVR